MNDHHGVAVGVGDTVKIAGTLTQVGTNSGFINCLFQLTHPPPPPPPGVQTVLRLNTTQVRTTASPAIASPGVMDELGRPVGVGVACQITGVIVAVTGGSGVNTLVQMDALMPPSSVRLRIGLNSEQVERTGTALTARRVLRADELVGEPFQQPVQQYYE